MMVIVAMADNIDPNFFWYIKNESPLASFLSLSISLSCDTYEPSMTREIVAPTNPSPLSDEGAGTQPNYMRTWPFVGYVTVVVVLCALCHSASDCV